MMEGKLTLTFSSGQVSVAVNSIAFFYVLHQFPLVIDGNDIIKSRKKKRLKNKRWKESESRD